MDPNISQLTQPIIEQQTAVMQPIVPPAPEQSSEPKTKLSKWLAVVIVTVVLVMVGGAGAYFLNKNSTPKPQPITTTVIVKPTPTPTLILDTTANWKTYTNTKYGFSFKYPASAIIEESPSSNALAIAYRQYSNQGIPKMLIEIYNKDDASKQNLYNPDKLQVLTDNRKRENFAYSPVTQLSVDNQTLYYYSEDFDGSSGALPPAGGPNNASYAYGVIGNYFYDILYENDFIAFGGDSNDFDRILSTLKFIR
jgi:hypothetical protein